jgi:hypothetical protein
MNLSPKKKLDSKKKKLTKYEKIVQMIIKEDQLCNCESGCRHDFAKKLLKVIN